LWGAQAGKKTSLIGRHHTVITSVHPSPLSAHRGFFGSRPFSRANRALSDHHQSEINWRLSS
jgi:uracil-DNA glycosylase